MDGFGHWRRFYIRAVALATVLCFTATETGVAQIPSFSGTSSTGPADPVALASRLDLGGLADTGEVSPAPANAPFLFLIEDLHANPEAQRKAIATLARLEHQAGLRWVAVEGAEGPLDPEILKPFPHTPSNIAFQDHLLSAGAASGSELAMARTKLRGFGAEDADLYIENVKAFQRTHAAARRARPALARYSGLLRARADRTLPPPVLKLLRTREAYDRLSISLAAYARRLASASRQTLSLSLRSTEAALRYPHLRRWMELDQIEREAIDSALARKDLETLRRALGDDSAILLALENRLNPRAGPPATPIDRAYLARLFLTARRRGVRLEPYLALRTFCALEVLRGELSMRDLSGEIRALEDAIAGALLTDASERVLYSKLKTFKMFLKLARLELTRGEWESLDGRALLKLWIARRTAALQEALRFYELAERRDASLVRNTLAAMKNAKQKSGALIIGGFHTSGITSILRERGVAFAVLTPRIEQWASPRSYRRALLNPSLRGGPKSETVDIPKFSARTYLHPQGEGVRMRHFENGLRAAYPIYRASLWRGKAEPVNQRLETFYRQGALPALWKWEAAHQVLRSQAVRRAPAAVTLKGWVRRLQNPLHPWTVQQVRELTNLIVLGLPDRQYTQSSLALWRAFLKGAFASFNMILSIFRELDRASGTRLRAQALSSTTVPWWHLTREIGLVTPMFEFAEWMLSLRGLLPPAQLGAQLDHALDIIPRLHHQSLKLMDSYMGRQLPAMDRPALMARTLTPFTRVSVRRAILTAQLAYLRAETAGSAIGLIDSVTLLEKLTTVIRRSRKTQAGRRIYSRVKVGFDVDPGARQPVAIVPMHFAVLADELFKNSLDALPADREGFRHGRVLIRARATRTRVKISFVSPGRLTISPKRLFKPHRSKKKLQAKDRIVAPGERTTRGRGRRGIGLAMALEIAQAHGGTLRYNPRLKRDASGNPIVVFELTLPIYKRRAPAATPPDGQKGWLSPLGRRAASFYKTSIRPRARKIWLWFFFAATMGVLVFTALLAARAYFIGKAQDVLDASLERILGELTGGPELQERRADSDVFWRALHGRKSWPSLGDGLDPDETIEFANLLGARFTSQVEARLLKAGREARGMTPEAIKLKALAAVIEQFPGPDELDQEPSHHQWVRHIVILLVLEEPIENTLPRRFQVPGFILPLGHLLRDAGGDLSLPLDLHFGVAERNGDASVSLSFSFETRDGTRREIPGRRAPAASVAARLRATFGGADPRDLQVLYRFLGTDAQREVLAFYLAFHRHFDVWPLGKEAERYVGLSSGAIIYIMKLIDRYLKFFGIVPPDWRYSKRDAADLAGRAWETDLPADGMAEMVTFLSQGADISRPPDAPPHPEGSPQAFLASVFGNVEGRYLALAYRALATGLLHHRREPRVNYGGVLLYILAYHRASGGRWPSMRQIQEARRVSSGEVTHILLFLRETLGHFSLLLPWHPKRFERDRGAAIPPQQIDGAMAWLREYLATRHTAARAPTLQEWMARLEDPAHAWTVQELAELGRFVHESPSTYEARAIALLAAAATGGVRSLERMLAIARELDPALQAQSLALDTQGLAAEIMDGIPALNVTRPTQPFAVVLEAARRSIADIQNLPYPVTDPPEVVRATLLEVFHHLAQDTGNMQVQLNNRVFSPFMVSRPPAMADAELMERTVSPYLIMGWRGSAGALHLLRLTADPPYRNGALKPVNVQGLVQATAERYRAARSYPDEREIYRDISFTDDFEEGARCELQGWEAGIHRLLKELIKNAIHALPRDAAGLRHGRIHVQGRLRDGSLVVAVMNDGLPPAGFDPEAASKPHLSRRAPEDIDRIVEGEGVIVLGGEGVGLTVARIVAQMHGGTLAFAPEVSHDPEGHPVTTFILTLPLPAKPPWFSGVKRLAARLARSARNLYVRLIRPRARRLWMTFFVVGTAALVALTAYLATRSLVASRARAALQNALETFYGSSHAIEWDVMNRVAIRSALQRDAQLPRWADGMDPHEWVEFSNWLGMEHDAFAIRWIIERAERAHGTSEEALSLKMAAAVARAFPTADALELDEDNYRRYRATAIDYAYVYMRDETGSPGFSILLPSPMTQRKNLPELRVRFQIDERDGDAHVSVRFFLENPDGTIRELPPARQAAVRTQAPVDARKLVKRIFPSASLKDLRQAYLALPTYSYEREIFLTILAFYGVHRRWPLHGQIARILDVHYETVRKLRPKLAAHLEKYGIRTPAWQGRWADRNKPVSKREVLRAARALRSLFEPKRKVTALVKQVFHKKPLHVKIFYSQLSPHTLERRIFLSLLAFYGVHFRWPTGAQLGLLSDVTESRANTLRRELTRALRTASIAAPQWILKHWVVPRKFSPKAVRTKAKELEAFFGPASANGKPTPEAELPPVSKYLKTAFPGASRRDLAIIFRRLESRYLRKIFLFYMAFDRRFGVWPLGMEANRWLGHKSGYVNVMLLAIDRRFEELGLKPPAWRYDQKRARRIGWRWVHLTGLHREQAISKKRMLKDMAAISAALQKRPVREPWEPADVMDLTIDEAFKGAHSRYVRHAYQALTLPLDRKLLPYLLAYHQLVGHWPPDARIRKELPLTRNDLSAKRLRKRLSRRLAGFYIPAGRFHSKARTKRELVPPSDLRQAVHAWKAFLSQPARRAASRAGAQIPAAVTHVFGHRRIRALKAFYESLDIRYNDRKAFLYVLAFRHAMRRWPSNGEIGRFARLTHDASRLIKLKLARRLRRAGFAVPDWTASRHPVLAIPPDDVAVKRAYDRLERFFGPASKDSLIVTGPVSRRKPLRHFLRSAIPGAVLRDLRILYRRLGGRFSRQHRALFLFYLAFWWNFTRWPLETEAARWLHKDPSNVHHSMQVINRRARALAVVPPWGYGRDEGFWISKRTRALSSAGHLEQSMRHKDLQEDMRAIEEALAQVPERKPMFRARVPQPGSVLAYLHHAFPHEPTRYIRLAYQALPTPTQKRWFVAYLLAFGQRLLRPTGAAMDRRIGKRTGWASNMARHLVPHFESFMVPVRLSRAPSPKPPRSSRETRGFEQAFRRFDGFLARPVAPREQPKARRAPGLTPEWVKKLRDLDHPWTVQEALQLQRLLKRRPRARFALYEAFAESHLDMIREFSSIFHTIDWESSWASLHFAPSVAVANWRPDKDALSTAFLGDDMEAYIKEVEQIIASVRTRISTKRWFGADLNLLRGKGTIEDDLSRLKALPISRSMEIFASFLTRSPPFKALGNRDLMQRTLVPFLKLYFRRTLVEAAVFSFAKQTPIPDMEAVDVLDMLHAGAQEVKSLKTPRGFRPYRHVDFVTTRAPKTRAAVRAWKPILQGAMEDLLRNAVLALPKDKKKYRRGRVGFWVTTRQGRLVGRISNDGVMAARPEDLFEFHVSTREPSDVETIQFPSGEAPLGGGGAGLIHARTAIELHGGTLDYKPRLHRDGKTPVVTFEFSLPLETPAKRRAPASSTAGEPPKPAQTYEERLAIFAERQVSQVQGRENRSMATEYVDKDGNVLMADLMVPGQGLIHVFRVEGQKDWYELWATEERIDETLAADMPSGLSWRELWPAEDRPPETLSLDGLYLRRDRQRLGIGSTVLAWPRERSLARDVTILTNGGTLNPDMLSLYLAATDPHTIRFLVGEVPLEPGAETPFHGVARGELLREIRTFFIQDPRSPEGAPLTLATVTLDPQGGFRIDWERLADAEGRPRTFRDPLTGQPRRTVEIEQDILVRAYDPELTDGAGRPLRYPVRYARPVRIVGSLLPHLAASGEVPDALVRATLEILTGVPSFTRDPRVYPFETPNLWQSLTFASGVDEELATVRLQPNQPVRVLVVGAGAGIDTMTVLHTLLTLSPTSPVRLDAIDVNEAAPPLALQNVLDQLTALGLLKRRPKAQAGTVRFGKHRVRVRQVERGRELSRLRGPYDFILLNASETLTTEGLTEFRARTPEGEVHEVSKGKLMLQADLERLIAQIPPRLAPQGRVLVEVSPDLPHQPVESDPELRRAGITFGQFLQRIGLSWGPRVTVAAHLLGTTGKRVILNITHAPTKQAPGRVSEWNQRLENYGHPWTVAEAAELIPALKRAAASDRDYIGLLVSALRGDQDLLHRIPGWFGQFVPEMKSAVDPEGLDIVPPWAQSLQLFDEKVASFETSWQALPDDGSHDVPALNRLISDFLNAQAVADDLVHRAHVLVTNHLDAQPAQLDDAGLMARTIIPLSHMIARRTLVSSQLYAYFSALESEIVEIDLAQLANTGVEHLKKLRTPAGFEPYSKINIDLSGIHASERLLVWPTAMITVLRELLKNAILALPKDTEGYRRGVISLRAELRGDRYVLQVVNAGPLPATVGQTILFKPHRTQRDLTAVETIVVEGEPRKMGGRGYGLALALISTEMHGGSLQFVPDPKETIFEVSFPSAMSPAARRAPNTAQTWVRRLETLTHPWTVQELSELAAFLKRGSLRARSLPILIATFRGHARYLDRVIEMLPLLDPELETKALRLQHPDLQVRLVNGVPAVSASRADRPLGDTLGDVAQYLHETQSIAPALLRMPVAQAQELERAMLALILDVRGILEHIQDDVVHPWIVSQPDLMLDYDRMAYTLEPYYWIGQRRRLIADQIFALWQVPRQAENGPAMLNLALLPTELTARWSRQRSHPEGREIYGAVDFQVDFESARHARALVWPRGIRVIFRELLKNALLALPRDKDGYRRGQIVIESRLKGGNLCVLFRNGGERGRAPAAERLFRIHRSYRKPEEIDRIQLPGGRFAQVGGEGLGLYVSRSLAELHGGALELLPDEPLTTFKLTLPLARSRKAPTRAMAVKLRGQKAKTFEKLWNEALASAPQHGGHREPRFIRRPAGRQTAARATELRGPWSKEPLLIDLDARGGFRKVGEVGHGHHPVRQKGKLKLIEKIDTSSPWQNSFIERLAFEIAAKVGIPTSRVWLVRSPQGSVHSAIEFWKGSRPLHDTSQEPEQPSPLLQADPRLKETEPVNFSAWLEHLFNPVSFIGTYILGVFLGDHDFLYPHQALYKLVRSAPAGPKRYEARWIDFEEGLVSIASLDADTILQDLTGEAQARAAIKQFGYPFLRNIAEISAREFSHLVEGLFVDELKDASEQDPKEDWSYDEIKPAVEEELQTSQQAVRRAMEILERSAPTRGSGPVGPWSNEPLILDMSGGAFHQKRLLGSEGHPLIWEAEGGRRRFVLKKHWNRLWHTAFIERLAFELATRVGVDAFRVWLVPHAGNHIYAAVEYWPRSKSFLDLPRRRTASLDADRLSAAKLSKLVRDLGPLVRSLFLKTFLRDPDNGTDNFLARTALQSPRRPVLYETRATDFELGLLENPNLGAARSRPITPEAFSQWLLHNRRVLRRHAMNPLEGLAAIPDADFGALAHGVFHDAIRPASGHDRKGSVLDYDSARREVTRALITSRDVLQQALPIVRAARTASARVGWADVAVGGLVLAAGAAAAWLLLRKPRKEKAPATPGSLDPSVFDLRGPWSEEPLLMNLFQGRFEEIGRTPLPHIYPILKEAAGAGRTVVLKTPLGRPWWGPFLDRLAFELSHRVGAETPRVWLAHRTRSTLHAAVEYWEGSQPAQTITRPATGFAVEHPELKDTLNLPAWIKYLPDPGPFVRTVILKLFLQDQDRGPVNVWVRDVPGGMDARASDFADGFPEERYPIPPSEDMGQALTAEPNIRIFARYGLDVLEKLAALTDTELAALVEGIFPVSLLPIADTSEVSYSNRKEEILRRLITSRKVVRQVLPKLRAAGARASNLIGPWSKEPLFLGSLRRAGFRRVRRQLRRRSYAVYRKGKLEVIRKTDFGDKPWYVYFGARLAFELAHRLGIKTSRVWLHQRGRQVSGLVERWISSDLLQDDPDLLDEYDEHLTYWDELKEWLRAISNPQDFMGTFLLALLTRDSDALDVHNIAVKRYRRRKPAARAIDLENPADPGGSLTESTLEFVLTANPEAFTQKELLVLETFAAITESEFDELIDGVLPMSLEDQIDTPGEVSYVAYRGRAKEVLLSSQQVVRRVLPQKRQSIARTSIIRSPRLRFRHARMVMRLFARGIPPLASEVIPRAVSITVPDFDELERKASDFNRAATAEIYDARAARSLAAWEVKRILKHPTSRIYVVLKKGQTLKRELARLAWRDTGGRFQVLYADVSDRRIDTLIDSLKGRMDPRRITVVSSSPAHRRPGSSVQIRAGLLPGIGLLAHAISDAGGDRSKVPSALGRVLAPAGSSAFTLSASGRLRQTLKARAAQTAALWAA